MHGRRLRASAARPRGTHRAPIGRQRPAGGSVAPGDIGEGAIDMQPSHTAIYARVSSDRQTADKTIASRLAALEARLAREGLRVAPEHRFVDEGFSGATLVRPALERLRDAAAAGALDRIYVHSPDRLARRYAYQVLLVDELRRAGVVFLNRAIGLSPEDDLLLQVQGMVAEYERAEILERSRRGKRHAAREGAVSVLSGAPYGYRYVGKRDGGGCARYQVDEEEARVVRLIFGWVGRDRVSIGEVCRRLQAQGYLTRGGKRAWDRTTVWGILKNPAYAGAAAFGKPRVGPRPVRLRPVRGGSEQPRRAYGVHDVPPAEWLRVPVPALIEGGLFEAAREQLEENRRRNRQGARGQRYLLQGLLVCRQCGYAYYGKAVSPRAARGQRRAYAYYRCCGSDAYRFGGQRVCANAQVRTDRLDQAVWREVERLLRDPARIAAEYERRLEEARRRVSGGPELGEIETQVAKLRRATARLIDGYAEGLIDKAEFEPRITGLRQRIAGWEERAASLRDEAALRTTLALVIGRLEDFAQRMRGRMAEVDWSLQRDLIRTLVKRVEIDRDGINVVFRAAPSPSDPRPPDPGGERTLQGCGWSVSPSPITIGVGNDARPRALLLTAAQGEPPPAQRQPPGPGQAEFVMPLIPLTQAWAQVVVGPVEAGGGDGSAAGLAAGVRGAVPRRRGLRPLAVREALARRVPLPRLRARQGLGAGPGHAAGRVRPLPPPDLGDSRHGAAPQPPAAQALVPGGVAGRDAPERDVGPAAVAAARARLLQDRLAAAPQAPPGDGRPRARAAGGPGGGGRDQSPLSHQGRPGRGRARPLARGQAPGRGGGRDRGQGAGPGPAGGDRGLLGRRAQRVRRRQRRRGQHRGERRLVRVRHAHGRQDLPGIPCTGGHDGSEGAPTCRDAKSPVFLTRSSTSCWRVPIRGRPSTRTASSTA